MGNDLLRHWIHNYVLRLQLCPFAKEVVQSNAYSIIEINDKVDLREELKRFDEAIKKDIETTFWTFTKNLGLDHFLDLYYVLLELCEEEQSFSDIQLVAFHPDYLHSDYSEDSIYHFTNRSPLPIIQLLRKTQVEKATAQYSSKEIISRNSKTLEEWSIEELNNLMYGNR